MDDIRSILLKKDFDVPPEVEAIKSYVKRAYDADVSVTVLPHSLVISAPSSGLIANLRLNVTSLKKAVQTDKRISFRIGS